MLAYENDTETPIVTDALLKQDAVPLDRSGDKPEWTHTVQNSALLRAPESEDNDKPSDRAEFEEADVAEALSEAEYPPIDWEYYLSITGPEVSPYRLLHFDEELEEVEYLYPTLSLEDFLEEAEPIVYAVFDASWLDQREEREELLEDLAERYDYVLFLMVDADSMPKETLRRYLVRDLPLFLIFQEGKIMSQVEGYHSSFSSAIEQSLKDILEP